MSEQSRKLIGAYLFDHGRDDDLYVRITAAKNILVAYFLTGDVDYCHAAFAIFRELKLTAPQIIDEVSQARKEVSGKK